MNRKIVIGYDPEHGGLDPVHLGGLLSGTLAVSPLVVTALPWPDHLPMPKDLQDGLDAEMRSKFSIVRDEFAEIEIETRVVASTSGARTLQEIAEDENATLIVIGPSHRGSVARTFGSVAESLMQGAGCAVAIAPRNFAERKNPSLARIAVAFDGSPEAWSALEAAIDLADRLRGEVTLLTAADYLRYGYTTTWTVLTAGELEDAERREKRRLLEIGLARIPDRLPSDGRLLVGPAGTVIAEASSEFDLLVMGSRGYGPLRRTIFGSTTRAVASAASCPLLVLPRAAGSDPLDLKSRAATAGAPASGR